MPYKYKDDYEKWREEKKECEDCGVVLKNKSRYDHKHKYCKGETTIWNFIEIIRIKFK